MQITYCHQKGLYTDSGLPCSQLKTNHNELHLTNSLALLKMASNLPILYDNPMDSNISLIYVIVSEF